MGGDYLTRMFYLLNFKKNINKTIYRYIAFTEFSGRGFKSHSG